MRELTLALPEVAPMLLESRAARNAASSSNAAGASSPAPPARIWLPVSAARPALPAGSRYAPVRTSTDTVTSGNARSGTM